VRLWRTPYIVGPQTLFAGTVRLDVREPLRLTRRVAPGVDQQRDQLMDDFLQSGIATQVEHLSVVSPVQNEGMMLATDGQAAFVVLMPCVHPSAEAPAGAKAD
jgi:hypothetical protein